MGIADSVTVIAETAAQADAAATLIANAVDLPDHPGVLRRPANALSPDSDLGALPVVTHVPTLTQSDASHALDAGHRQAESFARAGLVKGAALFLQGQARIVGASDCFETPALEGLNV
jgi:ApbE superfamily uncharacterized protein (UPF0280 family)